jgi:hypothetical protein
MRSSILMCVVIQQYYAVVIKSFYVTVFVTVTPSSLLVSLKILCQAFGLKIISLSLHCNVVI